MSSGESPWLINFELVVRRRRFCCRANRRHVAEKETDRFRAPNAQIECAPIGYRPLPSGCRQVSRRGSLILSLLYGVAGSAAAQIGAMSPRRKQTDFGLLTLRSSAPRSATGHCRRDVVR